MGVNLRGRNVGMAEQRLHHAEVGPVLQQMTGKSMAQHMRADLCGFEARGRRQRLELAGEMLAAQVPALAERGKQPFGLVELGLGAERQIVGHGALGLVVERH